jgi:hypothetical protein
MTTKMTATERTHRAYGAMQGLFDSYRQGQHNVQRAAGHCRQVADLLEDVAYWAEEALTDGEMTVAEHREMLRDAAILHSLMASAMLAVVA